MDVNRPMQQLLTLIEEWEKQKETWNEKPHYQGLVIYSKGYIQTLRTSRRLLQQTLSIKKTSDYVEELGIALQSVKDNGCDGSPYLEGRLQAINEVFTVLHNNN